MFRNRKSQPARTGRSNRDVDAYNAAFEDLGLGADGDLELGVVLLIDGPDRVQQREDLSPLDVAARRVAQDLLERVTVVVAELVFHRVA